MNFSFIPIEIYNELIKFNMDNLTEIRLRVGYPILITCIGVENLLEIKSVLITEKHIQFIIDAVTERSIYAFNNCIKQGFLTTKDGIRIGLAGECTFDNNEIVTIKNFTSLNIRIPHLIKNCSNDIIQYVLSKKVVNNTLILSPPGKGKTTLLKDIIIKLNNFNCGQVLVIDERNEFSLISGKNIDRIVYSNKFFAFNYALRSLSPDIVVTDELCDKKDWELIRVAVNSGVKVIATCHAKNINELINKPYFEANLFDRYVFLKSNGKPGMLDCVYDKELLKI